MWLQRSMIYKRHKRIECAWERGTCAKVVVWAYCLCNKNVGESGRGEDVDTNLVRTCKTWWERSLMIAECGCLCLLVSKEDRTKLSFQSVLEKYCCLLFHPKFWTEVELCSKERIFMFADSKQVSEVIPFMPLVSYSPLFSLVLHHT